MRAALWEVSPGALAALLNAGGPITKADLYTVTLLDGTVYRWSAADVAIAIAGSTWSLGPGLQRSRVTWSVGISVDTMQLTITDNVGTTINGQSLMAFIRSGGLLGAQVQVDRAFWGVGQTGPVGTLLWFVGRVGEIDSASRFDSTLIVKSPLELLDVQVPREVYQPGCLNTLFDSACGLTRAAFLVNGTVTGASIVANTTFAHGLGQAAGWFDLGVVRFTSGANAGISRTVKQHSIGSIKVLQPLPFPVAAGDAFSIYPGCDKTLATCTAKFANKARFRGHPYIPVAETVT